MVTQSATKPTTWRTYAWTYLALLVLATISLLLRVLPVTAYVSVGLAIAFVKAVLVIGYFMHMRDEGFGFKMVMVVAMLMVMVFVGLTAADPLTRSPYPPAPTQDPDFSAKPSP